MDHATEQLEELYMTISPEEEDYEARLKEAALLFRPFGEALYDFLRTRGHTGAPGDEKAAGRFLREQFRSRGMEADPRCRQWISHTRPFGRENAYELCFAFGLNVKETEDFFRRGSMRRAAGFRTPRAQKAGNMRPRLRGMHGFGRRSRLAAVRGTHPPRKQSRLPPRKPGKARTLKNMTGSLKD